MLITSWCIFQRYVNVSGREPGPGPGAICASALAITAHDVCICFVKLKAHKNLRVYLFARVNICFC